MKDANYSLEAIASLSFNELQFVISLAQEGLENKELARKYSTSEANAKRTIKRICQKIGVNNRVQIVIWAYRTEVVQC
jgi:DNA-binding NarL/FixJ family response regulator